MSRRLVWRPRPIMTWSCTVTPSEAATLTMSRVTWMSAFDGVGSPEGWLCTRIMFAGVETGGLGWFRAIPIGCQGATVLRKPPPKAMCLRSGAYFLVTATFCSKLIVR